MTTQTLQFVHRGEIVSLRNVPPSRTLLELLREDLHRSATKEGCNEGDCGACTVVLGEAHGERIHYRAVNSCIRLAHSIHGLALWTAEDLVSADARLHPVQQALLQSHASQCGFCTPGFVMSLFGLYQNHIAPTLATSCAALPPEGAGAPRGGPSAHRAVANPITRELAQQALSGNLCRCTGYRPILQAAQQMAALPPVRIDEAALLQTLKRIAPTAARLQADAAYLAPPTLAALLGARAAHPQAQLVAGGTDVGVWLNKLHLPLGQVLDLSQVKELRRVETYPQHIAIGAAVTLNDAFAALLAERPQLHSFATRFAGLPVRNAGTLGGNVANGSPIGDSMPLLIALGANVVLMSLRGSRELPLEQFYTGYRQNVLAADEVLAWIKVPRPTPSELLKVYKISKRFDDDISAVCLALNLQVSQGKVARVSIGVGGVAATPVRAVKTEAALLGQAWTLATVQQAMTTLRGEFQPISDLRASSSYRVQVLGNLLMRFWLESQGLQNINLEAFTLAGEDA